MSGDYDGSFDDKGFHHELFSGNRPNWLRVIRVLHTLNESMAGTYPVPPGVAIILFKIAHVKNLNPRWYWVLPR
jgi:hypothetical protein